VVNLALGGTLAFVLIQERLAQLLSDTFFVPGYFHFLTIGTVSLTLLAAFSNVVPGLAGRSLWSPRLVARLPYVVTIGLFAFGVAGVLAGLAGMPRRVLDAGYDGAAPAGWMRYSIAIGVGAAIMATGLAVYACALLRTLAGPVRESGRLASSPALVAAPSGEVMRQAAWTGPLSVTILVAAMYAATAVAFKIMQALPVQGAGGGH
jgi:cytochrome c oxidase subunit 1